MPDWSAAGKIITLIGIVFVLGGVLVVLMGKSTWEGSWFGWLGKLPGDILIKRDTFSLYFPLTTCILISAVISILAYLLSLVKR